MIVLCAGMKRINNELRRTQNELTLSEHFALFASFAVHYFFHYLERKGRKDSLIGLYAINYRGHREKWHSSTMPVTTYEKAAARRFRTRMTRIARIFTDIFDRCPSLFNSSDNKPQRSQRTQSRMGKLCALRVLCDGLTLFTAWLTRIYTYPRVSASSAQSAFHCRLSAFIRVHLRLIYVSLSDRTRKIHDEETSYYFLFFKFEQFTKQNIIKSALRGEI